jgi:glycosyltransferase involved in cell wall biosynthesis
MAHPRDPLTIAFPFAGDSVGGSHISVLGLLRHLDRSRFRPLVITEVPEGRIAKMFSQFEMIADPGARTSTFAPGQPIGLSKFIRTLAFLPARVRLLKDWGVSVVHSNDGRTHAHWALAARLAGIPLLWHHRGDPGALGLRLAAPLFASRVLAVSGFSKPRPGWWSAHAKSEVVHSPFDTSVAVDRSKARMRLCGELGVGPDTLLVGFFASFVPRKRPILFVDAVVELEKRLRRPVLGLMFGDSTKNPEVAEELDRRVKSADAARLIRILGFRDDGAFWIGACDQLMVPAVNEPFGRTLVEAMLVGTPVIAVASGGNVEALEGGRGVLVAPDDACALADAAARLAVEEGETREMAALAQADARRRFGDSYHAARVSEIYEELAGAATRPSAAIA